MPHVVIDSPMTLSDISRRFKPSKFSSGNIHLNMLDSYRSVRHKRMLIEIYVSEEALNQRVGLSVKRRQDGTLVVGLGEIGFPRVTVGIQLAIARLAVWLKDLHPDGQLLESNLQSSVWNDVMEPGSKSELCPR